MQALPVTASWCRRRQPSVTQPGPTSPVIKAFDRVGCISELLGILASAMHPDPESINPGLLKPLPHEGRAVIGLVFGDEVRRDATGMLGEPFRQGLERRLRLGPQSLVSSHLQERRDGTAPEIGIFERQFHHHHLSVGHSIGA